MAWRCAGTCAWASPPCPRRSCTPATCWSCWGPGSSPGTGPTPGGSMSSVPSLPLRVLPGRGPLRRAARSVGGRGSLFLVERHALVYRHMWLVFVSGVVEPLFYLLSIGVGLGHLVGFVQGPGGTTVTYAAFVAPALLASASMN